MSLNKSKGNMYPWCTHTWNVITGKCFHECTYCYMKRYKLGPMKFNNKEMNRDLGSGRVIFVGSSIDMWAQDVPPEWIQRVLERCRAYDNEYLFQSKDPYRFFFFDRFPERVNFGTTLESDVHYPEITKAPEPVMRAEAIARIESKRMVSIEPILAFNYGRFLTMIGRINPVFVSIGADSKGHNLPEPTAKELDDFVVALRGITEVKLKKNLDRLLLKEE